MLMGGTCCSGRRTARPDLPSELKDLFHQLSGVSLARGTISLSVPRGATSTEELRFAHRNGSSGEAGIPFLITQAE